MSEAKPTSEAANFIPLKMTDPYVYECLEYLACEHYVGLLFDIVEFKMSDYKEFRTYHLGRN